MDTNQLNARVTLQWTSIPSGGGEGDRIIRSCFMLQKPEIGAGLGYAF